MEVVCYLVVKCSSTKDNSAHILYVSSDKFLWINRTCSMLIIPRVYMQYITCIFFFRTHHYNLSHYTHCASWKYLYAESIKSVLFVLSFKLCHCLEVDVILLLISHLFVRSEILAYINVANVFSFISFIRTDLSLGHLQLLLYVKLWYWNDIWNLSTCQYVRHIKCMWSVTQLPCLCFMQPLDSLMISPLGISKFQFN